MRYYCSWRYIYSTKIFTETEIDGDIIVPGDIYSTQIITEAEIDGDIIVPGDNIMLDPGAEDTEPFVGTVLYMYNDKVN